MTWFVTWSLKKGRLAGLPVCFGVDDSLEVARKRARTALSNRMLREHCLGNQAVEYVEEFEEVPEVKKEAQ